MKKQNYMTRMATTLTQMNRKAFMYGNGQAWDNRKAKSMRTQAPRGRVYHRLAAMDWRKSYGKLTSPIEALGDLGWKCDDMSQSDAMVFSPE